jgi:hypothetical protein
MIKIIYNLSTRRVDVSHDVGKGTKQNPFTTLVESKDNITTESSDGGAYIVTNLCIEIHHFRHIRKYLHLIYEGESVNRSQMEIKQM